jgi:D-serine deaminase-like pyridoxal phosphate-dependent protein
MTTLDDVETPVPLVDLDRLDRNLARGAEYAARHTLAFRPHVKTHKSPVVAARQIQAGAHGLTCATPRELEVMSTVTDNLLLAYPPIGDAKLRRLMSLPGHVRLTVALDSFDAIDALAAAASAAKRTVRVYVELDVGMHRVGVAAANQAIALINRVVAHDALEYAGVNFYPGHIRNPTTDQDAALAELNRRLSTALAALDAAGVAPPVVSGGSTPTIWRTHEIAGVTEMRPGTYIYNDRTTAEIGACDWDDCALTVLATVVSTAVPNQAVVDAGTKSLGREPMRGAAGEGYGVIAGHRDVVVASMSEEHGILDLRHTDWRPRVGDRVRIIPNHVCIVVHLHETIIGLRGEAIETTWPVAARGRSNATYL